MTSNGERRTRVRAAFMTVMLFAICATSPVLACAEPELSSPQSSQDDSPLTLTVDPALVEQLRATTEANRALLAELQTIAQSNRELVEAVAAGNEASRPSPDLMAEIQRMAETNVELLDAVSSVNEASRALLNEVKALRQLNEESEETVSAQQQLDDPASGQEEAAPVPTDICYRGISMQEALIRKFMGPNLCAAIRTGELFRIEELRVDATGLEADDFEHMPNLHDLELSYSGTATPTALFTHLPQLQQLRISGPPSILHPDFFAGLPNLDTLRIEVRVPNDPEGEPRRTFMLSGRVFSALPNLKSLGITVSGLYRGGCIELHPGAFQGLRTLESLTLRQYTNSPPRETFRDLTSLTQLDLGSPCADPDGQRRTLEIYVANYEIAARLDHSCGACTIVGLLTDQR